MAKCSKYRGPDRQGGWLLPALLLLVLSGPGWSAEIAPVEVVSARPLPEAIRQRISELLTGTLTALLGVDGTLTLEALQQQPIGVAAQVLTGVNFELEDRGYRLTSLVLTTEEPIQATATLDLVGGGVESVRLDLADASLPPFWQERHALTLEGVAAAAIAELAPHLIGLPLGPRNRDWAREQVEAHWVVPDHVAAAWPDHVVTMEVDLAAEAIALLHLTPRPPLVTNYRVEARSDSLLMITLDPLEELLLRHADLFVGQPIAVVREATPALAAVLEEALRTSSTARTFAIVRPTVQLRFPDNEPGEIRALARTESTRVHLRAEMFVDLNNDDRPAEFEALAGWRLGIVEPFVVLNVLTEDVDVRADAGLGIFEGPWFAGAAWDISEGAPKAFASFSPIPQIRLTAEVYRADDDGQTQVGMLYQPTQQLGVGVFTDTSGLWWLRTSFRL